MSRKPPFTQWSDDIPVGTQLVLSHFGRAGELARVTYHETCSHMPHNWRVVKLRPDWKDAPAYKDSDLVPWEWMCPEPAFSVVPDELVFIVGEVIVQHDPPPPNFEHVTDWKFHLACVQRLNDPYRKLGWCSSYSLEVPWLI